MKGIEKDLAREQTPVERPSTLHFPSLSTTAPHSFPSDRSSEAPPTSSSPALMSTFVVPTESSIQSSDELLRRRGERVLKEVEVRLTAERPSSDGVAFSSPATPLEVGLGTSTASPDLYDVGPVTVVPSVTLSNDQKSWVLTSPIATSDAAWVVAAASLAGLVVCLLAFFVLGIRRCRLGMLFETAI